jgi:hypothetical protein
VTLIESKADLDTTMTTAHSASNGSCWCGCGTKVGPGKFFAPGHDRWAEAFVISNRYGNVAAFLEHHGYGPGGKNARLEAKQVDTRESSTDVVTGDDEDALDLAEAERRLHDPTEVPIPYEQARRQLGLS